MILHLLFDLLILFSNLRITLLGVEGVWHDAVEDFGRRHQVLLCLASLAHHLPEWVHGAFDAVLCLLNGFA